MRLCKRSPAMDIEDKVSTRPKAPQVVGRTWVVQLCAYCSVPILTSGAPLFGAYRTTSVHRSFVHSRNQYFVDRRSRHHSEARNSGSGTP